MPILSTTIVGQTDEKAWKISVEYFDAMGIVEVMWMPHVGDKPYPAELLPGIFIKEPIFDEQRMIIKHPATMIHTVEILGSMDTQEPRGVQFWAFSKLWPLVQSPTVGEMIIDLINREGCEQLRNFPKELLFKIGFVPTSLLVAMLPQMEKQ